MSVRSIQPYQFCVFQGVRVRADGVECVIRSHTVQCSLRIARRDHFPTSPQDS